MKPVDIFSLRALRSNVLAALSTQSTEPIAIQKFPAIVTRFLCLTLLVVFAAVAGQAQNTGSTTDGWVVLPVGEYTTLRRAAFPADAEPLPPPIEATLSRIDYDLKVDGDLATGEARLTVDVIKDGWVRLAMPDGLMVREANLDGRPVTLVARPKEKGPGGVDLLLSRTGRSVLTLKIVAQVSTVASTCRRFGRLPPVAALSDRTTKAATGRRTPKS